MIARLLLIDDDEFIRRSLGSSLSRAGFEVVTAEDGEPAMRIAQTTSFELVVVDYHMKESNGADVVRHFKERYGASVYCAVLSGEDDDETRAVCRDAGADDVFVKPASPTELRARLTEAARSLKNHGP